MTDAEHESLIENRRLRQELDRVRQTARRAITAAIESQDAATGGHEAWLDAALQTVGAVDA